MQMVAGSGMDATTWANVLFSGTFVIFLTTCVMLELYERTVRTGGGEGEGRRGEGSSWFSMLSRGVRGTGRRREMDVDGAAHYFPVPAMGNSGTSSSENSLEELRRSGGRDCSMVFDLADDDDDDDAEWKKREKARQVV